MQTGVAFDQASSWLAMEYNGIQEIYVQTPILMFTILQKEEIKETYTTNVLLWVLMDLYI